MTEEEKAIFAPELAVRIARELEANLSEVDAELTEALLDAICRAKRVFVAGRGRSLLVLRCFAMRLMHLGLRVHVAGETTTPAIEAGDLLIVGSGSGRTASVVLMAEKARQAGAEVAALTIYPDSELSKRACVTVRIPGVTAKNGAPSGADTIQISGNGFEQGMLLLCDAMAIRLAKREGIACDDEAVMSRHANLE